MKGKAKFLRIDARGGLSVFRTVNYDLNITLQNYSGEDEALWSDVGG